MTSHIGKTKCNKFEDHVINRSNAKAVKEAFHNNITKNYECINCDIEITPEQLINYLLINRKGDFT